MKKITACLCAILTATVLFTACKSTSSSSSGSTLNDFFKFGNAGEFETTGDIVLCGRNTFGKFEQKEGVTVIHSYDSTLGLGASLGGLYYYTLFTEENLKNLEAAYNKYLIEFENKTLQRKSNKSQSAYGSLPVNLRWGTFKNTTPNYGSGRAMIGYSFVDNSPYFTITMNAIYNKYYDEVGDIANRTSANIVIYFTKAQMQSFLDNLTEEKINAVLHKATGASSESTKSTGDIY